MKLLKVDTINDARNKLLAYRDLLAPETEMRPLAEAAGRILAEDICSNENIPPYRRSTMDGYAVRSGELGAAGDMIPTVLKVTGEVTMGTDTSELTVEPGQCVYVPTGGGMPAGADAVVMVEYCEPFGNGMLAVSKSAAPGENVVQTGEDIADGDTILKRGRLLRPQDIGVLAAIGVTSVPVSRPWRVTVISTGDELVSCGETPGPGRIRDINSYTIAARSASEGFEVVKTLLIKDDREAIALTLEAAKEDSDVVVISGGSSQGKKDMTAELVDAAADSGVLTHGIAAKPGKPTITGVDKASRTLFIGLPGHPAAALMVYEQLLIGLWRDLSGRGPERAVRARLTANVPSAPGRMTFQPVKICMSDDPGASPDVLMAEPVIAKSGMISPLSAADGYFVTSENSEGVRAGDLVDIYLWK